MQHTEFICITSYHNRFGAILQFSIFIRSDIFPRKNMRCPSEHRVQGINLSSNFKYPCYSVSIRSDGMQNKKNLLFCSIFQCSCLLETSIKEKSWIVFFFNSWIFNIKFRSYFIHQFMQRIDVECLNICES